MICCYTECVLCPGLSPISRVREKSLSLLGVIAGLVLLMLLLALITCIRQRQMYKVTAIDIQGVPKVRIHLVFCYFASLSK